MRVTMFVLAGICAATTAIAQDFPARKAGLWEMTLKLSDDTAPTPVVLHCIDAASDKKMQEMASGMMGGACKKNVMRREGAGFVLDSDCTVGSMHVVSKGTITGDFNSSYVTRIEGIADGKASVTTITAKYLGACKAGQKAGDMVINGRTMNVLK